MKEASVRPPQYDLTGQVAIITGAAGLLGASFTRTLAGAGAHVVAADVDGEGAADLARETTEALGVRALGLETDVSAPESVRAMVDRVLQQLRRVDILVNCAAIDSKFEAEQRAEPSVRFEDLSYEAWQRAMAVNVTGMFLCSQAVAAPMVEAGRGVLVNVSSIYGLVGPDQRLYQREGSPTQYKSVTYSVSKAAALGLTRYLATYFAGTGIRVNTLTPGGVLAAHDDEFVRRYSARTVLGRMAERDEIASALLFLVSEASSYMTGANLVVDGGWTAW